MEAHLYVAYSHYYQERAIEGNIPDISRNSCKIERSRRLEMPSRHTSPKSPRWTLAPGASRMPSSAPGKSSSEGILIGVYCLNWRQPVIRRSLKSNYENPNNCNVPSETPLRAVWNKKSTLRLSLVRGNVVFKRRNSM